MILASAELLVLADGANSDRCSTWGTTWPTCGLPMARHRRRSDRAFDYDNRALGDTVQPWLKRVRATLGLGLLWAAGGVGGGGVIFAVVLMIAARRQRFDELSMARFAGWGAFTGLTLGALAMSIGAPAVFLAIMTGAGTVAAAGSLLLARRATQHASPDSIAPSRPARIP